jgi:hypothetical protein
MWNTEATVSDLSLKPMPLRWIESLHSRATEIATEFLLLPKGEGRDEGENNPIFPTIPGC